MRNLRPAGAGPRAFMAVLAALTACGDRLVGSDYAGEPLAVLSGSLVPTPETEVTGPVRLALAWYPQWMAAEEPSSGATVASIVTEDVQAQGTFPVDFRFPVYRPPPRAALAPLGEGLAGKGAFGVLLAYQDLDGDGRLGSIPTDGAPVDRVLAASLLGDPRSAFALIYVDSPQPEETGLLPGFNLVQGVNDAAAVVPLTTRMKLSLTAGGPVYDGLVCEAGWLTYLLADVCGLGGGGPLELALAGRIALDGTRLQIELEVTSVEGPHPEADVNVNGRVIPWVPERGAFVLEEDASTLVRPGSSFVVSATAAGTSVGQVFSLPGEFAIEAPAAWQTVSARSPLVVGWTASAEATSYLVGFDAPPAGASTMADLGALSITFDATGAAPGQASAFVEARIDAEDARAFVTTALVRRQLFYMAE